MFYAWIAEEVDIGEWVIRRDDVDEGREQTVGVLYGPQPSSLVGLSDTSCGGVVGCYFHV